MISIHALLAESDGILAHDGREIIKFLSTLSLRRATLRRSANCNCQNISIHALLAESDSVIGVIDNVIDHFYPRSPCGERPRAERHASSQQEFLSTLSLRRATRAERHASSQQEFLSTLSLRRATKPKDLKSRRMVFLSTLSLRRATAKVHKTVGHFCAYETNFMEIASSC